MIPSYARAQLYHCPHCGREGFTRQGLCNHYCTALRGARLSGKQWVAAVKGQDMARTQRALKRVDQEQPADTDGGREVS